MTAHPHALQARCPSSFPSNASASPSPHPTKFTLINSPAALTATLSAILQSHVTCNDALPAAPFDSMTVFHALEPPSISVADYVARVSKYVFCSEACLVAAYHYLSRVISTKPNLTLTSLTVHRLFITAVVLACKYFDDLSYNLMYYSKVGGLPTQELANLEINMLRMLNFRLDIPIITFQQVESNLIHQVTCLSVDVAPQTGLATLVRTARLQLLQDDLIPPMPTSQISSITASALPNEIAHHHSHVSPSTDTDAESETDTEPYVVYHRVSTHAPASKPVPLSPVTSECTNDTLSRNPSTDSMTSCAGADTATDDDCAPAPSSSQEQPHRDTYPPTVANPTKPPTGPWAAVNFNASNFSSNVPRPPRRPSIAPAAVVPASAVVAPQDSVPVASTRVVPRHSTPVLRMYNAQHAVHVEQPVVRGTPEANRLISGTQGNAHRRRATPVPAPFY